MKENQISGIEKLLDLTRPCWVIRNGENLEVTQDESFAAMQAYAPAVLPENLGDVEFQKFYGLDYPYMAGAMAGGIASAELVIAMGREKFLSSFGAGGLSLERIESAIQKVQAALPEGPYCFNLLHSPFEDSIERRTVELYLRYGVTVVEAAAFLNLTPHIVRYRASGLSRGPDGRVVTKNRVIAKISRREVARHFMEPAPADILQELVAQGFITAEQAELAGSVPMADDVIVEADSGGHTDNRPLTVLLPSLIALRDEIHAEQKYDRRPVGVGAGGGIGAPDAALAALMMGAAFIVTGTINQGSVEAGTSEHVKELLSQSGMADVTMAPAGDMFEMGVRLQVLKKGTMYPMRAQKLYELYTEYSSIEEIPAPKIAKLEKMFFKDTIANIWKSTAEFFQGRDPEMLQKANEDPRQKMALIFRWYLGQSSRWGSTGEKGREFDYQIWCGPAIGAFNDWVAGTQFEDYKKRNAPEIAKHMMKGAAYQLRVQTLRSQGVLLPHEHSRYSPGM